MSLDFKADPTTGDLTLTETGDVASVTGPTNAKQQITTVVARAVESVSPVVGAADRARLTGALRDQLDDHEYVDSVVSISTDVGDDADTVEVTVNLVSDEVITTSA